MSLATNMGSLLAGVPPLPARLFPSTMVPTSWSLGDAMQSPSLLGGVPAPRSVNAGKSDVPVNHVPIHASARVAAHPNNRLLRGGDLLFHVMPLLDRDEDELLQLGQLRVLNLAMANAWLRTQAAAARQYLMQNPIWTEIMAGCTELYLDMERKNATSTETKTYLAMLTNAGVRQMLHYLGPCVSQANMMEWVDPATPLLGGNDTTHAVWCARGPTQCANFWDPKVRPGDVVWIQLRWHVAAGQKSYEGHFVLEPVVRLGAVDFPPDDKLVYTGIGGAPERAKNFRVGRIAMNGIQTVHDELFYATASGMDPSKGVAHYVDQEAACKAAGLLERVQINVSPTFQMRYVSWV